MIIIYGNVSKHGQEIVLYMFILNYYSFYIVIDRYEIEKREQIYIFSL